MSGTVPQLSQRPELRVRQVFSACSFCKARKIKVCLRSEGLKTHIKCDGAAPACGACAKFGRSSSCSLYNDAFGHQCVDYVTYLQNRLASLQKHDGQARKEGRFLAIDGLVAEIEALPILASSYPTSFGGPTLSTLVLGAASKRPLDQLDQPSASPPLLPKSETAIKLIEHYVQDVYPRLPFFSLQGLWAQWSQVYSARPAASLHSPADNPSGLNRDYSYFTILIVLAIAASSLSRSTDSIISSQSQRLFHEALRFRESAILPTSTVGVQSLLFLIQYAVLNPSLLDAWYLIGVAMRTCINLGLHQDPNPVESISPSLLETRRRLWWSVYSFDRSMSLGCGRPTEISDKVIEAQLPSFQIESSATEAERQGYLQRYRALQLQSLIYDTLNRREHPDPPSVVEELADELNRWNSANLPECSPTLVESEWLIARALLYRPCPLVPQRSPEELHYLWAAGTRFIALYRQLVEANKIYYTQIASEKSYWTGLGILYSFWKLPPGSLRSVDLWLSVNNVLYILRTLSERWEEGRFLTEEFEKVSSSAIQLWETRRDVDDGLSWQIVEFGHQSSLTSIRTQRGAAEDGKEMLQELVNEI